MTTTSEASQDDRQIQQIEAGQAIERELSGSEIHVYQLLLDAGQYVNLAVDQRGIDVLVRLLGPDGKLIMEFNSERGSRGKETVELVTEIAGSYRLNVGPRQQGLATGRYEIRIVEIRQATDDDRTLQEARNLHTEFRRLYYARKEKEAIPVLERALVLREKVLGPEHPLVAAVLHGLATLYRGRDNEKAVRLHHRARTIWEKTLGPDHPYVAMSLNNLGNLYDDLGEYTKAEQMQERALAIMEKALGTEHRDVADSLHNLGGLYHERGAYTKAEPLYLRALAIRQKALGPEHPDLAALLDNLVGLYHERGDYEKAESLARKSLSIREKNYGPEHTDVAFVLNYLANVIRDRGDYAEAENLYHRAQSIWQKTRREETSLFSFSLNDLAILYRKKGEYRKAEQLHLRARGILEKLKGPQHPIVAEFLNDLATLYNDSGEHTKAEPLLRKALEIHEKSRGLQHPYVAVSLNNLAVLYAAKGDIAQSIAFQSRANAAVERNLSLNLGSGSERQKIAFLALFSKQTDFTLSLHSQAAPNNPQALTLACTTLLRRKGRGLDEMTDTIAASRHRATPQDQALFSQLVEARSQYAALTLKDSDATNSDSYRTLLKTLEEKVDQLEEELSARSDRFRGQTQPVTIAAVQAALPMGSTLVEFARYNPREPRSGMSKPPRYLAYVLAAQGQPRWVELGEAAVIDRAVDAWRKALRDPSRMDVRKLGRAVDEKVMRPVRSLLGETRRLLIAPDGALNLIPFAALVDEGNRYQIERYVISYLTSGRDLLRLQTTRPSRSAPLVVAHPNFGRVLSPLAQATRSAGDSQSRNSERAQIFFQALPSTRGEAMAIKSVLPAASVLLGEQATEAALRSVSGPRILHIATHGFFLGGQASQPAETRGSLSDNPLRISDLRLSQWAAQIENPLLRSGLALAGANREKNGEDDGLLTALEAASLDLWGTKLVTLSACDTGIGVVKNGEGVQGLRRALVLAGSESQVMSLWAVLDRETKELMISYYKALQRGVGRSDGLRQAQLRMLRSRGKRHPFYWASFIQSGEWANLDGQR